MHAVNLSYCATFSFFISQCGVKINDDHIYRRYKLTDLEFQVCMQILGSKYVFNIFVSDLYEFCLQLVLRFY